MYRDYSTPRYIPTGIGLTMSFGDIAQVQSAARTIAFNADYKDLKVTASDTHPGNEARPVKIRLEDFVPDR